MNKNNKENMNDDKIILEKSISTKILSKLYIE